MAWSKQSKKIRTNRLQRGTTLVEVVILVLIFSSAFLVVLSVFEGAVNGLGNSKAKVVAVELATAQMEILRNLTYDQIGTINGSPAGVITDVQTMQKSNINFTITTTIHYVDDPFDGCVGEVIGQPTQSRCADGTIVNVIPDTPANNNNPADYKKADVTITWDAHYTNRPVSLSTIITPKGLEGITTKGFLLISVFDSAGQPVADASIHIVNTTFNPDYDKTFTTDAFGTVLLLDLDPATDSYVITISKAGYSSDRTCSVQVDGLECSDSVGNPDPLHRNVSISQGQLEEISFSIDQLSTLAVHSYNEQCVPLANIDFTLQGAKTISNPPSSILKNVIPLQTDAAGSWSTDQLEWDLYDLFIAAGYDIAGINHDLALNVLPATNTTLNVLLAAHTDHSLLLTVKDNNDTSVSGASVRLTKAGYDETKTTGHGFIQQTDWSGGSAQTDIGDSTKYFSNTAGIDAVGTTGQLTLTKNTINPTAVETFDTQTQADIPNTDTEWSGGTLSLAPSGGPYPINTMQHAQSIKLNAQHAKIISATLTASQTANGQSINYFLSADGGITFEPVTSGVLHTFGIVGSDLRFRVELQTSDSGTTPTVEELSIGYTAEYFDTNGELISSTFNLGSAATFTTLSWNPPSQALETGADSAKFQIATNTDNATWNFLGPDGTGSTYYTSNNAALNDAHDTHTYLRYKLILSTADVYYTPQLTDIHIGYTLQCLPPGQTYFNNLEAATYTAEVTLAGFQTETQTIDVNGYTTQEVHLIPS